MSKFAAVRRSAPLGLSIHQSPPADRRAACRTGAAPSAATPFGCDVERRPPIDVVSCRKWSPSDPFRLRALRAAGWLGYGRRSEARGGGAAAVTSSEQRRCGGQCIAGSTHCRRLLAQCRAVLTFKCGEARRAASGGDAGSGRRRQRRRGSGCSSSERDACYACGLHSSSTFIVLRCIWMVVPRHLVVWQRVADRRPSVARSAPCPIESESSRVAAARPSPCNSEHTRRGKDAPPIHSVCRPSMHMSLLSRARCGHATDSGHERPNGQSRRRVAVVVDPCGCMYGSCGSVCCCCCSHCDGVSSDGVHGGGDEWTAAAWRQGNGLWSDAMANSKGPADERWVSPSRPTLPPSPSNSRTPCAPIWHLHLCLDGPLHPHRVYARAASHPGGPFV